MLATSLNIVTRGEVMCVVWVLALFTVIHDHWPLPFCAGILDAALRYGIIPCIVWYFGNWKLKYAPIHVVVAVRTLTAVTRIAMMVWYFAVLLKFIEPFQVRLNSKQRTLYMKTCICLCSHLERK